MVKTLFCFNPDIDNLLEIIELSPSSRSKVVVALNPDVCCARCFKREAFRNESETCSRCVSCCPWLILEHMFECLVRYVWGHNRFVKHFSIFVYGHVWFAFENQRSFWPKPVDRSLLTISGSPLNVGRIISHLDAETDEGHCQDEQGCKLSATQMKSKGRTL